MKSIFERNFQRINTNGIELNVVVEGLGPLVILLHGFPQCSFLWRHQIDPLVQAGYTVAVPDQRGYGTSDAPIEVSEYMVRKLAGDVAGIAKELGFGEFIVIGQDWGAPVAWHTALLHEDVCKAVMGMSVPYARLDDWDSWVNPPHADDGFWYIRYFQQKEIPEQEIETDLRNGLLRLYSTLSGEAPEGSWINQTRYPRDAKLSDILLPANNDMKWLSDEELNYYVRFFETGGLRGPINWYRAMPLNGANTQELSTKKISQPAAFVAGAKDDVLKYAGSNNEFLKAMEAWCSDLRFKTLIPGAGHWLQCEQPEATNKEILRFLEIVS